MLKKWLACYIFKKELENVNRYLKQTIAEQQEQIKNLETRLTQYTNGGQTWK